MPYFIDLNENELDESYSDDTRYGGHYSKKGNKFIADILYKFLKEQNILQF